MPRTARPAMASACTVARDDGDRELDVGVEVDAREAGRRRRRRRSARPTSTRLRARATVASGTWHGRCPRCRRVQPLHTTTISSSPGAAPSDRAREAPCRSSASSSCAGMTTETGVGVLEPHVRALVNAISPASSALPGRRLVSGADATSRRLRAFLRRPNRREPSGLRLLVTGHLGYLGVEMTSCCSPRARRRRSRHRLLRGLRLPRAAGSVPSLRIDLRDVEPSELEGFDAVVHLAALSNDPLSDLNPDADLRHQPRRVGPARRRRRRPRASSGSCSRRRAASTAPGGGDLLDEQAAFNPVTPYGESKVRVEHALSELADDDFTPTYLRNATAFGVLATAARRHRRQQPRRRTRSRPARCSCRATARRGGPLVHVARHRPRVRAGARRATRGRARPGVQRGR